MGRVFRGWGRGWVLIEAHSENGRGGSTAWKMTGLAHYFSQGIPCPRLSSVGLWKAIMPVHLLISFCASGLCLLNLYREWFAKIAMSLSCVWQLCKTIRIRVTQLANKYNCRFLCEVTVYLGMEVRDDKLSTLEVVSWIPGHPLPCSEFEASLGYMWHCFKNNQLANPIPKWNKPK